MEGRIRSVRVVYEGMMSYSDLAPVLDELNKEFRFVRTNVMGLAKVHPVDQGRGGPGLGVDLQILIDASNVIEIGVLLILKDFLSEFAKDGYKSLRSSILNLKDTKRKEIGGPEFVSFGLAIGGIQFHFDEPMTEDEFVRRLDAARTFAERLPDSLFLEDGPHGRYFAWDRSARAWRGPYIPGQGPD